MFAIRVVVHSRNWLNLVSQFQTPANYLSLVARRRHIPRDVFIAAAILLLLPRNSPLASHVDTKSIDEKREAVEKESGRFPMCVHNALD